MNLSLMSMWQTEDLMFSTPKTSIEGSAARQKKMTQTKTVLLMLMKLSESLGRLLHRLTTISALNGWDLELIPLPTSSALITGQRSEEHKSELQSRENIVSRLLL